MMSAYPSILNLFKRDEKGNVLRGQWTNEAFYLLQNVPWFGTEKVDGTNIRVIWDGQSVEFRGRTDNAQMPPHLLKYLQASFTADKFADMPPMVVYGEGYGAKIQKSGGLYRTDGTVSFVAFDVYCGGFWLRHEDLIDIACKLGCDVVPILGWLDIAGWIDYVSGPGFPSALQTGCNEAAAEGVVIQPSVQLFDRRGQRIIAKVKVRDFRHD